MQRGVVLRELEAFGPIHHICMIFVYYVYMQRGVVPRALETIMAIKQKMLGFGWTVELEVTGMLLSI
jgi:hypothetical protein